MYIVYVLKDYAKCRMNVKNMYYEYIYYHS